MMITGKGPEITGHRVFISYCNGKDDLTMSDRPVGDRICSALESHGGWIITPQFQANFWVSVFTRIFK